MSAGHEAGGDEFVVKPAPLERRRLAYAQRGGRRACRSERRGVSSARQSARHGVAHRFPNRCSPGIANRKAAP